MNTELADISFVAYALLIVMILEHYKESEEFLQKICPKCNKINCTCKSEKFGNKIPPVTKPPLEEKKNNPPEEKNIIPKYGFLPRNKWSQLYYGRESSTPIPGTNRPDPIGTSYSMTTTIALANPYLREEACLPIEGNIGSKIDIATEIFGPFERTFIL